MSWSYRRVRHTSASGVVSFAIHEAYYDANGRVWAVTQDPVGVVGDTEAEVIEVLVMMQNDILNQPTLDYDSIPEEGAVSPLDKAAKR